MNTSKHSCIEAGSVLDRRWNPPNVLNSAEPEIKHDAMKDANPIYQLISDLSSKITSIESRLSKIESKLI